MTRRKGDEAEKVAQKGLEARLELLIRNDKFRDELEKGREMYFQYRNAPTSVYCPPDSKDPNYQKWREKYHNLDNVDKRQEWRTQENQLKFKYDHYLAKWDLNWGPWEYVDTKGMDFPNLSPKELKELFNRASSEREKCAQRDLENGEPGPPEMFRLPVISWDPVEHKRAKIICNAADAAGEDGITQEELEAYADDLVPGQVGKKLTLELNLTFPRDVLEELVRLNLEQVFNRRKEPPKRQRLGNIEDQLRVFDLAKKGLKFSKIRTQFTKRPPLSTVKSTYVSICQKINSINTSPSTNAEPSFEPATHMTTCPQCKRAINEKQFCKLAKQYINAEAKKSQLAPPHETDWERFDPTHYKPGIKGKGSRQTSDAIPYKQAQFDISQYLGYKD
jgi:hypothetical protein